LSSRTAHHEAFYIGSALGAILFALITNIILPFRQIWITFLVTIFLSLLVFPIAAYFQRESDIPILNKKEAIVTIWMTLVGLGTSIGIHWRKEKLT